MYEAIAIYQFILLSLSAFSVAVRSMQVPKSTPALVHIPELSSRTVVRELALTLISGVVQVIGRWAAASYGLKVKKRE